jgi:sugar/nucleoside kinase (ribokinase family)
MLSGEANLVSAGLALLDKGPRWVAVKKGEHGVLVLGRGQAFCLPGNPTVNVTDPTGAGDCFAGGFLGSLDRDGRFDGPSIRRAAAFGSVMASFAIEDYGLERFKRLKMPEVEERYRRFRKLVRF